MSKTTAQIVREAKQKQSIMYDAERLIRCWNKRDRHPPYSNRWIRWDKRASRKIERLSRKLERCGLYQADWFVRLYKQQMSQRQ